MGGIFLVIALSLYCFSLCWCINKFQLTVNEVVRVKYKTIMGCLAALGLAAAGTAHAQDDAEREDMAERLKPAGELCLAGQDCGTSAAADDAGGEDGEISGSDIYGNVCAACHDSGAAGAPARGEEGDWEERIDQGIETLYEHAINGIGAMPPRGGNADLSDEEVMAATNHLVEPLMDDLPEVGAGSEEEASDNGEDAASDEEASADNGGDAASEEESAANGEDAAGNGEESAVSGDDSGIDGEEIYASVCAACHDSGAAGAPVTGEAGDWEERLEKGTDELYSNAIEGVGAMPPKGGRTDLSDEEVQAAVDHMLEAVE